MPGGLTQEKSVHLDLTSDPAELASARNAVEDLGRDCGFDETSKDELGLVVNEAIANIIRHAYKGATDRPIHLDAHFSGKALHIWIRDWGSGVNPLELPPRPRDPLQPGGLGLVCIRRLMDNAEFCRQPDGMLLKMSRTLAKRPGACVETASSTGEPSDGDIASTHSAD
jgi:serine/threonine-protein kinase RsbW